MVERDQYGYLLKIVAYFPDHPWWRLTSQLAEGFRDRKRNTIVSAVGIYTPKFGLGALENPKMIGRGDVDAGIINPPVTAKMAMEGTGPFTERIGELRALARGFYRSRMLNHQNENQPPKRPAWCAIETRLAVSRSAGIHVSARRNRQAAPHQRGCSENASNCEKLFIEPAGADKRSIE